MTAKKLAAAEVALPRFEPGDAEDGEAFSLTSHTRAREAIAFGLSVGGSGFNIFVLGDDSSGRMTATLAFMEPLVEKRPVPDDWVYLNNFAHPHNPKPYRLPAGVGRRLRERMAALVPQLGESLSHAFGSEDYQGEVRSRGERVRAELTERMEALSTELRTHDLDLVRTPDGQVSVAAVADGKLADLDELPPERRREIEQVAETFSERLAEITRWGAKRHGELTKSLHELERRVGDHAIAALLDEVVEEFSGYAGLARWLTELRVDILENLVRFSERPADESGPPLAPAARQYAVNLLVDHCEHDCPRVIVEANPTHENVFGRIEYRQLEGGLETDFTLIRAGSLQRANGGVLVLRAEALARNPAVWEALKGALRDRQIRLEELQRTGMFPIAGAPRPDPIPLDVKVVIVGSPRWYYTFFSADPEFRAHFKVKADIDGDMDATPENLACYAGVIRRMARDRVHARCDEAAVQRLLGVASRWAANREKLTARFEQIANLIDEAVHLEAATASGVITEDAIVTAMADRRRRNARVDCVRRVLWTGCTRGSPAASS